MVNTNENNGENIEDRKPNNDIQNQLDDIVWAIRRERMKRKKTQADLAKEIGVSTMTITRMESFSSIQKGGNPNFKILLKCIDVLGLKIVAQEK